MGGHVSLAYAALISFEYILQGEKVGSYGRSILSYLRNPHIVLHNGSTDLHSYSVLVKKQQMLAIHCRNFMPIPL